MLFDQSKANLDDKILVGKIIQLHDPKIKKPSARIRELKREFHLPFWSMIYLLLKLKFYF